MIIVIKHIILGAFWVVALIFSCYVGFFCLLLWDSKPLEKYYQFVDQIEKL